MKTVEDIIRLAKENYRLHGIEPRRHTVQSVCESGRSQACALGAAYWEVARDGDHCLEIAEAELGQFYVEGFCIGFDHVCGPSIHSVYGGDPDDWTRGYTDGLAAAESIFSDPEISPCLSGSSANPTDSSTVS